MLQWMKAHRNIIIGSVVILLVLLGAFLFGGPGTSSSASRKEGSSTSNDGNGNGTETASATETAELPVTEEHTPATFTCTLTISCADILEHMDNMEPAKAELVPANGVILETATVTVSEGESAYDVLRRTCTNTGILLDAGVSPVYESAYIRGINNIYEFDCGSSSGWKYTVNGTTPNYGCSSYLLQEGDSILFYFTDDINR